MLIPGLLVIFLWSGIAPHDRFTWFLEVLPSSLPYPFWPQPIIGSQSPRWHMPPHVPRRDPDGGGSLHPRRGPVSNWIKNTFNLGRNDYDQLGHFVQGSVPAIIAWEVLLKRSPLEPRKWLFFIVVCICLDIRTAYELLEWGVAVLMGSAEDTFLGT
jgi:putative membrane protein